MSTLTLDQAKLVPIIVRNAEERSAKKAEATCKEPANGSLSTV
jgi:hypothetical protein